MTKFIRVYFTTVVMSAIEHLGSNDVNRIHFENYTFVIRGQVDEKLNFENVEFYELISL